jgi:hypothetical protein
MIQWRLARRDALLCGVGAAVLFVVTVPVIRMGGVVWMLVGGALMVPLYRRRLPGATITPGMGMRLGALAGVFGFLFNAVTSLIPRVQQMMQNLLDYMSTPQGAATMIAIFLLIFGVVFVLLSAAGGAVGASISGQRRGSQ